MKILLWVIPTFHRVHTLHAKICYALSYDMDAVEKIFTNRLSFENFKISELRWVHGLKDWSWLLACILWITAVCGPMRCSYRTML